MSFKKVLSLMLSVLIMLGIMSTAAFAQESVVSLDGTGTAQDPYLINNLDELKWFRDDVNNGNDYSGKYVALNADIDLNSEPWTPIGYLGKTFKGTFDGSHKTIKNLYINKSFDNKSENNTIGFFGRTDSPAVIKNLIIENVDIQGSLYVGAVVGYAYTGKRMENCTVKGNIAIDAWWYAGVIGGNGYMNIVDNCHVIANSNSYIKGNGGSYIGGIWGFRGEGANNITNCTVSGLSISGDTRIGGICGIAHYGNTISDCSVSNCTINALTDTAMVGLIAGSNQGGVDSSLASYVINNEVLNTLATNENGTVSTHSGSTISGTTPPLTVVGINIVLDENGLVTSGKLEEISSSNKVAEGLEILPNGTVGIAPVSNLTKVYSAENKYWGECTANANESFVIKFYNEDTYMGSTSLNNIGGIIDGDVQATFSILFDAAANTDEYWTMEWTVPPTLAIRPTRAEHWVDGNKAADAVVELNLPDNLYPCIAAVTDADGKLLKYVNNYAGNTLEKAFNAGGNITLLSDITLTDALTVPAGKTLNLDLNGYTISQSKSCSESYAMLSNNGTLTINDSVGTGKISLTDTGVGDSTWGCGSYTIRNAGTLTINNGTIEMISPMNENDFRHCALAIFNYSANTTINGGTVTSPQYRSIRLWSGDLTITNGNIDGQVWVQACGDERSLNISGGNFSPNGVDGSSVYIETIDKDHNIVYNPTVSINGGSFATKIGCDEVQNVIGGISGGTFTAAAATSGATAALCENAGCVLTQNEDGTYGVAEKEAEVVDTLLTNSAQYYDFQPIWLYPINQPIYRLGIYAAADSPDYDEYGFEIKLNGENPVKIAATKHTSSKEQKLNIIVGTSGRQDTYQASMFELNGANTFNCIFGQTISFTEEALAKYAISYRPYVKYGDTYKMGKEFTIEEIYKK